MTTSLDAKAAAPKGDATPTGLHGVWNAVLARMFGKNGSVTIHFKNGRPIRDQVEFKTREGV